MTKKQLSQLYWLDREIQNQEERLAALELEARNIVSKLSDMPKKQGVSDKIGTLAGEIADLKALINLNIQKRWYERNQIIRYIMAVDDSLMRQILIARFVDGKNWLQVAESVGGHNTADSVKKACYRFLKK